MVSPYLNTFSMATVNSGNACRGVCRSFEAISELWQRAPGGGAATGSRAASAGSGEERQQQVGDAFGAHRWSCGEQRLPARPAAVQPAVVAATAAMSEVLRPRVTRSLMGMMQ